MSDKRVISPINQCELTGLESVMSCPFLDVAHYVDHSGCVRLVYKNLSGLILDVDGTISQIYTVPEMRRQGLAKSLVAIAAVLGYTPKHSSDLTEDGKQFVKGVKL